MPATGAHILFGRYLMPSLRHATVADAMRAGIRVGADRYGR